MLSPHVYREEWEVAARLMPFGVTRAELLEVVRGVVAARADAVDDDPLSAAGQFAYIYGTRYTRALFRSKGYLPYRREGIEGFGILTAISRLFIRASMLPPLMTTIRERSQGKGPAPTA